MKLDIIVPKSIWRLTLAARNSSRVAFPCSLQIAHILNLSISHLSPSNLVCIHTPEFRRIHMQNTLAVTLSLLCYLMEVFYLQQKATCTRGKIMTIFCAERTAVICGFKQHVLMPWKTQTATDYILTEKRKHQRKFLTEIRSCIQMESIKLSLSWPANIWTTCQCNKNSINLQIITKAWRTLFLKVYKDRL